MSTLDDLIAQVNHVGAGIGSGATSTGQQPSLPVNNATVTANNDPLVYMGPNWQEAPTLVTGQEGNLHPNKSQALADFGPQGVTMSAAQLGWYRWSDKQQLDLAKQLYAWGYIDSPTDIYGARDAYFSAMQDSANNLRVGKTLTPLQVLDKGAGVNSDKLKARLLAGKDGITTTRSVNLSSKLDVQAIATQVLQQALGRSPTDAELNTYYNTIRAQEAAHPSVETRTPKAGGLTTDVTTGGFSSADAQQYLLSQVQNDPEYAKYQAGTTYFNAAMAANAAIGGA